MSREEWQLTMATTTTATRHQLLRMRAVLAGKFISGARQVVYIRQAKAIARALALLDEALSGKRQLSTRELGSVRKQVRDIQAETRRALTGIEEYFLAAERID